jgi:hypothetical protein
MTTNNDDDTLEARDVYSISKKILRGIADGSVKPEAACSFAQVVTAVTNMAKAEHQIHEMRGTKSASGFLPDADDSTVPQARRLRSLPATR